MKINKKIQGDFSFLPIHCQCPCHELISLNKERILIYEKHGYPKYIVGHSNYVRETTNNEIQGDFSFLSHYCQCGCNEIIPLSKNEIKTYFKNGYLRFIKGHNSRINCSVILTGDFEYVPHFCKHCGQEIPLKKERFRNYELYGYPETDEGHHNIKYICGEFEFLSHYCKCCGKEIPLRKDLFAYYERHGYPQFFIGHNSIMNSLIKGDFCFIPHFCKHCGKEINLKKNRIWSYENYGYPEYLQGHKTESNIVVSSDLFCFVPYKCKHCDKYIKLDPKRIWWYEHGAYPEYIHRHNPTTEETKEKISISVKISIEDPEVQKKRIEAQKKSHTPEANLKKSKSMKKIWDDPKYHKKMKDIMNSPEIREQIINSAIITWSNLEIRAKVSGKNNGHWRGGTEISYKKHYDKTKSLGWNPLNPCIGNGKEMMKGFERHHVTYNDIIYVPKEYNQCIIHRLATGYNMLKINTLAYFFLIMNHIEELNKLFNEDKNE